MQRPPDIKVSSIQALVFGHHSGRPIHILFPEMKEELIWVSLGCQNFCNSPKERNFQTWQLACMSTCLYLFSHAVCMVFGCDGRRKELCFSVSFLDSCIFSFTGDCSKLSVGDLMLNPLSFTPGVSWCRRLHNP